MLYTVRVCMPVQLSQRQRLSTESCSCLHHKKLYHQTGPARQDAFVVEIYSVDYFYLKIFYTMITCSKKKYALNRDIEITIHVLQLRSCDQTDHATVHRMYCTVSVTMHRL